MDLTPARRVGSGGITVGGGSSNIVIGPKITGSYPPQMSAVTLAKVDALVAAGMLTTEILWVIQGSSAT